MSPVWARATKIVKNRSPLGFRVFIWLAMEFEKVDGISLKAP
jgi:hypothetical protein